MRPGSQISVLHLIVSLPVGGAEDLLKAIVMGLDARHFAARVVCLGELGPVGAELRSAGFSVTALGLDVKHASLAHIVSRLRRHLQENPPDILHTHLYHPNLYGRLAALGLGLQGVVAAVHNSYTHLKFHRRLWNFLLQFLCDRLLVGSPRVYEDVRRFDHVAASRLLLLPYGIRLDELDTPLTASEAKNALGISGFCVGTIGRLEEQKGQKFLLQAAAALISRIPDLNIVIVGSGRLENNLRTHTQDLGLADRVHFLGTRRDLALIYRALDVFILPSLWEGLPLALLKAMAAGLPVVATRVSGSQTVVQDGINGILVPPGEAAPLAAALLELHQHPPRRASLGAEAKKNIRENYSLEAMLRQLEALYRELAARVGR